MYNFLYAGVVASLVTALPSAADTEFEDSIPIDVAEVLFDASLSNELAIYSDIASDFPPFSVPDGFSVVGSVVDQNNTRAVLRTNLRRDQGVELLITAFEQQNWQEFPAMEPPVPNSGFVTPTPTNNRFAFTLCHDDLGHLSVRSIERVSVNYFTLATFYRFGNRRSSCTDQLVQQEQAMSQMGRSSGIRQYMPRMEVPKTENIRPRGAFIGGGLSSSNNSAETEINLTSELDIEELYKHFADQIVAQDWEIDSEVVGGRSANGIWTRSPSTELELVGMLSVLQTSEGEYELQFRLRVEGDIGVPGSVGISVLRSN